MTFSILTKTFKILFLLSLFFIINTKTNAQAPNWLWAKFIGDTSYDRCLSLTLDQYGNIYTTGIFVGIVDFDPGNGVYNMNSNDYINIFICKMDSSGNFIWAKSMGQAGAGGEGKKIILDDSCNVYITGYYSGSFDFDPGPGIYNLTSVGANDIFICKLDSSGNFIWARGVGGTGNDQAESIAVDGSGNSFITGYFYSTVDFDPGPPVYNIATTGDFDLFVLKLDMFGNFAWVKTIGGTNSVIGESITTDTLGNLYLTGVYSDTVDFDTGPGILNLITGSDANSFILKLDSSGNTIWAKAFVSPNFNVGFSITVDNQLNVYTTGWFKDYADFDPGSPVFNLTSSFGIFISKLDNNGNFVWAKSIGGSHGGGIGYGIAFDNSENIYVTGNFYGTVDADTGPGVFNLTSNSGYNDIFVAKLDNMGSTLWAKSIGGSKHDYCYSIGLDAIENIYLAGYFESPSLQVGSEIRVNADSTNGSSDIFIAKIDHLITGIETINKHDLIYLYPNPTNDYITIDLGNNYSKLIGYKLRIVNVHGTTVYSIKITQENYRVDRKAGTSNGVYFVYLLDASENLVDVRKIVMQ